jgi:membrane fusion protein, multidrug efflux system
MDEDPRNFEVTPPGKVFYIGWVGAIILIVIATAGLVLARDFWIGRQTSDLEKAADLGPHVLVAQVGQTMTQRDISLPATIRGYDETQVYAKIPGYISKIFVDKGDRIHKNEVIALIESPELDQQVANALATYKLALVTDKRYEVLVRQGVVPQQTADTTHLTMLADKAAWEQLVSEQGYKTMLAPFDGIVTERLADPGHLIPQSTTPVAAGSAGTGVAVIAAATLKPVRIFAYVPQNISPFIRNGDQASITVTEYPSRTFEGTVTRHPDALSPDTRTMLVEVDMANEDTALLPGMYATAHFVVSVAGGTPMVPDDALVFRNGKVYVPIVRDNHLHLSEVALGYDNGQQIEITKGVGGNDMVAINVGQAARDGEPVQPVHGDAGQ